MFYGYSFALNSTGSGGTPPVNTVAPAVTGTAQVGQTLSCSSGTWTGTAPITYAYQWKRGGVNIGGATSATYTLVSADAGTSIKCTVTATNGLGSSSADSNIVSATWETDAQAFITAASITDPTQKSAVNQLVIDLKAASIWSKMLAFYPFVGGSASSVKFNLKDPRDLDAAFRLTISGGVTYTNGFLSNGTTGYANTHITPSSSLIQNNTSIFYKSTTNAYGEYVEMGVVSGTERFSVYNYLNAYYTDHYNLSSGRVTFNEVNTTGFIVASRVAANDLRLYRNGSQVSTTQTGSPGTLSNVNKKVYLGALNNDGSAQFYTPRNITVAGIGSGLTPSEVTSLTTIINTFDTAIGR